MLLAVGAAQEPAFKSDVSLVELEAEIIGNGGVIGGLHLRDFAIKDDRQPVSLRYCEEEETSLDVLLVGLRHPEAACALIFRSALYSSANQKMAYSCTRSDPFMPCRKLRRKRDTIVFVRALYLLLAAAGLSAFAPGQRPVFEVASVKVNKSGDQAGHGQILLASGRLNFLNTRMRDLIMWAYSVRREHVIGPGWLDTDRFDIVAKARPNTKLSDARLMLQSLLVERFNLAVRHGERLMPVFVLITAKEGSHLKPSSVNGQPECIRGDGPKGLIHINCTDLSVQDLADYLPDLAPGYIDRPIVDSTQLKGTYDLKLDWAPKPSLPKEAATISDSIPDLPAGPTIFDELQKHFGLRLKPEKRPMPIIVINHVERVPTDN
ncbi:MAG TPA: TIGR03435 family protein [Bryobacteraceae bacterium]|nr:TIGR03435 family protein [Bryobacteraceae bacterium]